MFTLIKNAKIYAPEFIGIKSLLICGEKITWMGETFPCEETLPGLKIIDAEGMALIPGIVDGHVHITGGGGEGGRARLMWRG